MRRFPIAPSLVAAAILVAACSPASPAPSTTANGTPGPNGACATAPAVENAPGWGSPAQEPALIPVLIANPGELVCGSNRILFTFVDKDGRPVGAPDRTASAAFYDLARDPAKPIATVDGTFVWAIENERGDYIVTVDFPEAGSYGVEFKTAGASGAAETVRMTFDVQPSNGVVKVGDVAPASKTPTLADAGNDPTKISTDPSPDPAFYQTSIDQAEAAHKPFVVIFATPKFCTSSQCGPTLDRIKPFVARYPSVAFIHVEPYKLKLVGGTLQADTDAQGGLVATEVSDQWGLLSEPWVFVVGSDGIVRASLELIFTDAELTAALDAVK
jgi:hypothetical protein